MEIVKDGNCKSSSDRGQLSFFCFVIEFRNRVGVLGKVAFRGAIVWLVLLASILGGRESLGAVTLELPMDVERTKVTTSGAGAVRALPGGGLAVQSQMLLTNDFTPMPSFDASALSLPLGVQADGRLIVRSNRGGIAMRLNWDGSIDPSFTAPAVSGGDQSLVQDIVVQPDGKILVASFRSPQSVYLGMRRGLFRLNVDGTEDGSFVYPTAADVRQVIIRPDGKILELDNELKLLLSNGAFDSTFNTVSPSGGIGAMARQPDGKIVIYGGFSSIAGIPRPGLARVNADGSLDFNFDPDPSPLAGFEFAVRVQSDGRVIAASSRLVQRYLSTGKIDNSFSRRIGISDIKGFDIDSTDRIFISQDGVVTEYSGRVRVEAPPASIDAVLERSSSIESGWTQVQSIPANTTLDFIDSMFPGTQNVFYRARPVL